MNHKLLTIIAVLHLFIAVLHLIIAIIPRDTIISFFLIEYLFSLGLIEIFINLFFYSFVAALIVIVFNKLIKLKNIPNKILFGVGYTSIISATTWLFNYDVEPATLFKFFVILIFFWYLIGISLIIIADKFRQKNLNQSVRIWTLRLIGLILLWTPFVISEFYLHVKPNEISIEIVGITWWYLLSAYVSLLGILTNARIFGFSWNFKKFKND